MNRLEQAFSMFEDPSNSLIILRCNLIEELYRRQRISNSKKSHLTSLVSRISDSGHIKHGEEGTPAKITLYASIEYGVNYRGGLMPGNKRWLLGERSQCVSPYESDKEPEPHTLLKQKLRIRCVEGVDQAKIYVDEFGPDYIYKSATPQEVEQEERGRTRKRTHPGAFDRKKVVDALTLLRNTYPIDYEDALAEAEWAERNQVNRKTKKAKVSTPMPSPTTSPQSPPLILPFERLYYHSDTSNLSFTSFVSADTFGAGVKTIKSKTNKLATAMVTVASKIPGLRHITSKKTPGLRRVKGEKDLRQHIPDDSTETLSNSTKSSNDSTESLSPFEQALQQVAVSQDKTARISEWIGVAEYKPESPEELDRLIKLPDSIYDSSQHTSKGATKEFAIRVGITDPPEAPPRRTLIARSFCIDGGVVLAPNSPIEELYDVAAASVEALTMVDPPCDQFTHPTVFELSGEQFRPSPIAELSIAELPVAEMYVSEVPCAQSSVGRVSSEGVSQPCLPQAAAPVEIKKRTRDRLRGRFTFGARL